MIPARTIPHRVAEEVEVVIFARDAEGKMIKTHVRLLEDWWVAAPGLIEGME